jgi:hypothetical protein
MTIEEIRQAVEPHKPMSKPTVYKYLKSLRIRPVSKFRQSPQRYPQDAALRILESLGYVTAKPAKRAGKAVAR